MIVQPGEREQGLRKILDWTRMISVAIWLIHFYYYGYDAFKQWQLNTPLTDQLLSNIAATGLFQNFQRSKWISLAFLAISLMGSSGKKEAKLKYKTAIYYMLAGLLFYYGSYLLSLADSRIYS